MLPRLVSNSWSQAILFLLSPRVLGLQSKPPGLAKISYNCHLVGRFSKWNSVGRGVYGKCFYSLLYIQGNNEKMGWHGLSAGNIQHRLSIPNQNRYKLFSSEHMALHIWHFTWPAISFTVRQYKSQRQTHILLTFLPCDLCSALRLNCPFSFFLSTHTLGSWFVP